MTFVNKIASIVHINVVKMGGSNNKNIGDAFLFVWKIASYTETPAFALRLQEYMKGEGRLNDEEEKTLSIICDCSCYCVMKVIAKINSYQQILHYREHKGLNERIKDYKVKMGFGLHLGWAIEGLIGSSHKVDASYLSPHVNLASRLEAATKQYGVNFLMSENVYLNLSQDFKSKCRCVDRCTLKGVANPMYLYTLETDVGNLPKVKDKYHKMSVKERQKVVNYEKTMLFEKLLPGKRFIVIFLDPHFNVPAIETSQLLDGDKEMRRMLHFHKLSSREPFIKSYKKAFKYYLKGVWEKSKEYLQKCLMMDNNDGPSKVLLEYIESNDCKSENVKWKGYRILTEK
jgi:class 3 adenylate cyclase